MRALVLALGLLAAASALAAYQVRAVPVKVAPYYEAAEHREQKPRVATASGFDRQLASLRAEDIAAVRDAIRSEPASVTPITMMVLAVRLYDVGLRDESVFWFHAARDRMATASAVLDDSFKEIARIEAITRTFALQAGPTINGYSLCDPARHSRLRREALDWVEKNPYTTLFVETIPAKPADRRENLAGSLARLKAEAAEDAATLAGREGLSKLAESRRQTKADEKYCWK
jgi:hypothetical protein